jgi:small conductance mechanosensitive channel
MDGLPQEWIALPEPWMSVIRVVITLVAAGVVVRLGDKLITRAMSRPDRAERTRISEGRQKTLASLLKSIYFATGRGPSLPLRSLNILGIDTSALLGGAAILGVAVGWALKTSSATLSQAFLSSFEGQYDIGTTSPPPSCRGSSRKLGCAPLACAIGTETSHVVPNGLIEKTN